MAHCHIAEHHESGMMFSFDVTGMSSRRPTATEQREVVVIGGGQAGLAIGYLLAQQGRRFTILEAAERAGRRLAGALGLAASCSRRCATTACPGLAFPGEPDSYPGRDDVVAYLTDYARHFELPVEFNSRVAVRARATTAASWSSSPTGRYAGRPGRRRHRAVPGAVHAADRR